MDNNRNFFATNIHLTFVAAVFLFCAFLGDLDNSLADSTQRSFINKNSTFFRLFFYDRADIRFGYLRGFEREESDGPGAFTLNHLSLKGEVPLALDNDVFLRFGGDYHYRNYQLRSVNSAVTNDSSLDVHALSARVGGGIFLDRNLLLTGILRPGLFSDFDGGVDSGDAKMYGDAMLVYGINPGTQIVGGLAYDHVFSSESFYPLIGFRVMNEDGRLHISVTVPREARIGFSLNPKAELFARATLDGEQFEVAPGQVKKSFGFKEQERKIGGGFSYWITRNFNLEVEGGMFLNSDFRFKTSNPGQFDNDADSGPYLTASFGVAL